MIARVASFAVVGAALVFGAAHAQPPDKGDHADPPPGTRSGPPDAQHTESGGAAANKPREREDTPDPPASVGY